MASKTKDDMRVRIVGAGLGGLLTAIVPERARINYRLLERVSAVKPLGAAIGLNANILPVFVQLGLLDALKNISFPMEELNIFNRKLKEVSVVDQSAFNKTVGYEALFFSRPELYEDDDLAAVYCSDNSQYSAEVVVGADGAYSAIRQTMYRGLSIKGLLPPSDKEEMDVLGKGLLAVTEPLDPEKYPFMKKDVAKFISITGENGNLWSYTSIPDNRLCWGTAHHVDFTEVAREKLVASSWGPESTEALVEEVRLYPLPGGGTMGDLIDHTPKERISKAFFEQKLFETWHLGRLVLLGDACHKMSPGAGQNAVNAMQDAVVLVNCLNNLDRATPQTLRKAFQDYQNQRYFYAKDQVENSLKIGKIFFALTWFDEVLRWIFFHLIPAKISFSALLEKGRYQPQASFLPLAAGNPDFKVLPQNVFEKYGAMTAAVAAAII